MIKQASVEVNEADKDAFIEASKPIYDAFAEDVEGGQEMIDAVLALGNASRVRFRRPFRRVAVSSSDRHGARKPGTRVPGSARAAQDRPA